MKGKHCKLYDENLVFSIMASTGVSVLEYMKKHKNPSVDEIYEHVEKNGQRIIEATIEDMNCFGDMPDKFSSGFESGPEENLPDDPP